ncbi:hypothetical protein [Limnochorda pilosa]|uniref:Chemotactic signal-response protein chel n=1 Tax=Limnochorda pilosa TaxID=1555112 RepID=A0A0K2SPZ0_LIMPI|nr:hypothetical protein [Limnochorda pilosa]BAS28904.1 chemotactic signal-response protein chel [Limnochorda pilosa]
MDPLSPLPAPLEGWTPAVPGAGRNLPRNLQEAEAAAREIETLFLQELLKSLESSLPSGSLLGGGASPIRAGMVREELARFLARQGGIGLAESILESLRSRESHPQEETGDTPENE